MHCVNRLKRFIKEKRDEMNVEIKVIFIGYPNVGKSTLINSIKGKKSAGTSSSAHFTRGIQFFRLDKNILLIDMPGVIPWNKKEDEASLAIKGAINAEKVSDPLSIAELMLDLSDKTELKNIYNIEYKDPTQFLENYAINRGWLLKKGVGNILEASKQIIRDWQRNKIPFYITP